MHPLPTTTNNNPQMAAADDLLFPHITPGCNQLISPVLDFTAYRLLCDMTQGARGPLALRINLRCVRREVVKNRVQMVILAIDINTRGAQVKSNLTDIVKIAAQQGVPVVYALGRQFMGNAVKNMDTPSTISAVGIPRDAVLTDEETRLVHFLKDEAARARQEFQDLVSGRDRASDLQQTEMDILVHALAKHCQCQSD